MDIRKSTLSLLTALILSGAASAFGDDGYTFTPPPPLRVAQTGWNELGSIKISANPAFDSSKKLVVTVSSANGFTLKAGEASDGIAYLHATNKDDSSSAITFTFTADQVNAGISQLVGVIVNDFSKMADGIYTDEITYTAVVDDAITWNEVDISAVDTYEAQNGDLLTSTAGSSAHITVAAGATIKLKNATITSITDDYSHQWPGISCYDDATIILEGDNAVKGGYEDYPGIYVPENATLTIKGSGSLTASSNGQGAGIGGGFNIACGNIVIEGGNITATGGTQAAGIGGGDASSCGNITITDGVTSVTASKGNDAPNSIGAGANGTCGTVTIADGANVTQN